MNLPDLNAHAGAHFGATDLDARIDAWRARGAERLDPVRFRLIEAMARRLALHEGPARRVIEDRLAALLAALAEKVEKTPAVAASAATTTATTTGTPAPRNTARQLATPPPPGPLGELLASIAAQQQPSPADAASARLGTAQELKTLSYFRSTWSRLSADRRWTQSLATVPDNAGPLNSHHLLHRSLTLMRDLSPAYFNQFMSYADALLSIEQMQLAAGAPAKPALPAAKKTTRRKAS